MALWVEKRLLGSVRYCYVMFPTPKTAGPGRLVTSWLQDGCYSCGHHIKTWGKLRQEERGGGKTALFTCGSHVKNKDISQNLLMKSLYLTDEVSLCLLGWSAVAQSQLTATSASWVQAILLPQSPESLGLQTGFHHIGQAGLELPTSSDPPALASKVLGLQAQGQSLWLGHCVGDRAIACRRRTASARACAGASRTFHNGRLSV
ncbi:Protein SGT1-like protein [Plecturocebus cupreus]